jgi:hypothetical protein
MAYQHGSVEVRNIHSDAILRPPYTGIRRTLMGFEAHTSPKGSSRNPATCFLSHGLRKKKCDPRGSHFNHCRMRSPREKTRAEASRAASVPSHKESGNVRDRNRPYRPARHLWPWPRSNAPQKMAFLPSRLNLFPREHRFQYSAASAFDFWPRTDAHAYRKAR